MTALANGISLMAMTHSLAVNGGDIAYDLAGEGPLVVLAPGLGDLRQAYRFLAPALVHAGYRVATVDLRGHGQSSTGFAGHTRADVAADLTALVEHLGGPAVIVGASFAGGSAVIMAARSPDLVRATVLIDPGTRKLHMTKITSRWLGGMARLGVAIGFTSVAWWLRYYRFAYPDVRPADFDDYVTGLGVNLAEPGRMAAAAAMGKSWPTDAQEHLARADRPCLVIMGGRDPDFPDPRAEADGIVGELPAGRGETVIITSAGHYPHAQFPGEVASAIVGFLRRHHVV